MKSWNEIRKAATAFSKRWKNAYDEKAQAQSFLKEFFAVFGVDTVVFNAFEHRVKFTDGSQGYADCFWQGKILVEMKSAGKDLDTAYQQAMEYVRTLPPADYPHAVVVSDFQRFRFYNLEKDNALTEFALKDLRKYVTLFGYMIGADDGGEIREQDPVNRKAAEQMARLHDAMKAVGYTGHPLEVYLVRLLFCLFAEDTGIFKPDQFSHCIDERTAADGSDLAAKLAELFQVLNTPKEKRLASRDETIAKFPYVNGGLFAEMLPIAAFSAEMRKAILDCAALDWSKISPAIFGAMFQGVMDEKARHDLGAHYTAEEYILRLIRPLFLDALRDEFEAIVGKSHAEAQRGRARGDIALCDASPQNSKKLCGLRSSATLREKKVRLEKFHEKIASLTFLDPACGCGNFLLIAYRELRRLEMDVLEELHRDDPEQFLDISQLCKVSVSQFYGIEIEQFPAEIAKVALWLMDHLCNMEVADRFGQYFARIPIKDSPHIVCANALRIDWSSLLNASVKCKMESVKLQEANQAPNFTLYTLHSSFDYIFGNPPFGGKKEQSATQKSEVAQVFGIKKPSSVLDYVTAWYKKAIDLIEGTKTECAFVSTNSICQGEHIPAFWNKYILPRGVHVNFAHQTFKWSNDAKGVAAVHCVIIGFSYIDHKQKQLFVYDKPTSDPRETVVPNINAYLYPSDHALIERRDKSINALYEMCYGNVPLEWGTLMLTEEERTAFIAGDARCEPLIKFCMGGDEWLNGGKRFCLWLVGVAPSLLRSLPMVVQRVELCREKRLASKDAGARKLAERPTQFRDINNPDTAIIIPKVSSERRKYVPMGFIGKDVITTGTVLIIPNGTLYMLGVLMSALHMAWMRTVGGRMEMRYQYSKDLVYNNFVWPSPSDELKAKIEEAAQDVLDVRAHYPDQTLAALYDPLFMPPDLVKAHAHLDALVDKAYGLSPSCTDADRVAHLFKLYAEKTAK